MELLNGKVSSLYRQYLCAAFGSALVLCIYGVVDTAMVGQYHGPEGTAALAVVAPVWNVIYSLGLAHGHRRQRDFQHPARRRAGRRQRKPIFYGSRF